MKRLYIAIVLALAAGMFAGLIIKEDPGYILMSWGKTTVEMSLWVGLVLQGLILIGFYLLIRTLVVVRNPVQTLNKLTPGSREKRAQKATVKGLLLLSEGQWRKAERLLSKSADRSGTPLVNYLAAAKASHAQGHSGHTDKLLKKALESSPGAETAVEVAQAEIQYERGQYEQCLAALLRIQKQNPRHRWALKTLMRVYKKLEDWKSLQELYPQLLKNKVISGKEGQDLLVNLNVSLLKETTKLENDDKQRETVQKIWQNLPSDLKENERLIEAYARGLLACNAEMVLERFINERLRKRWSDKLVIIYGLISKGDADQHLKQTEKWLEGQPDNASLLLTAGRLCLRNQLWGKGAEYLEASFRHDPLATTAAELSRLYSNMGRATKSRHYYQQCLNLAGYHLPGLPMPEASAEKN